MGVYGPAVQVLPGWFQPDPPSGLGEFTLVDVNRSAQRLGFGGVVAGLGGVVQSVLEDPQVGGDDVGVEPVDLSSLVEDFGFEVAPFSEPASQVGRGVQNWRCVGLPDGLHETGGGSQ